MSERPSWYEVVEGEELEQGDILLKIPIVKLPDDFEFSELTLEDELELDAEFEIIDAVIMSQSCDLAHSKIRHITVCRVIELGKHSDFPQQTSSDFSRLNDLRVGKYVNFHLLDRCLIPNHERDFLIVEFQSIHSLPTVFTKKYAAKQGKRLRLKSPYKEHLSQAFARVFMRVGLPSDIPKFEKPK